MGSHFLLEMAVFAFDFFLERVWTIKRFLVLRFEGKLAISRSVGRFGDHLGGLIAHQNGFFGHQNQFFAHQNGVFNHQGIPRSSG